MLCRLQSAHGSLEPPKAMSWSGTTCTAMYCGETGCGQEARQTSPGPGNPPTPSLTRPEPQPGVVSPAPQPGTTSSRTISPCSLPANLGRLAGGLRQLLGKLGKEPVRHGGAGDVGVHHEHRHAGGETAATGAQELNQAPTAAAREPELRDRRAVPPPRAAAAPPPVTPPPAEAPPPCAAGFSHLWRHRGQRLRPLRPQPPSGW